MVAPIPELMATFRVLVVPWALPSRECECEMLTVEAPISVRFCGTGSSLTEGPRWTLPGAVDCQQRLRKL